MGKLSAGWRAACSQSRGTRGSARGPPASAPAPRVGIVGWHQSWRGHRAACCKFWPPKSSCSPCDLGRCTASRASGFHVWEVGSRYLLRVFRGSKCHVEHPGSFQTQRSVAGNGSCFNGGRRCPRCPCACLHQAGRDSGRGGGLLLGPGEHATGQVVSELSLEAGGSSA